MTERPGGDRGMSTIVKMVARWLQIPILVYGIYTVLYGHLGPGGGFAGGVMIATGLGLRTLAYGETSAQRSARARAGVLESAGALLFVAVAFVGVLAAGTFFQNVWATPAARHFTLLSGGLIPLSNVAIALKVGGGLFLAFCALALVQREFAPGGAGREDP